MELRQLVYFDAIVRHGGFTRAAAALHVAQPAVSAQLRTLERELGTALLHRTTRSVTLTHEGEVFLARVRAALRELDAGRAELADVADVVRGELRVGAALTVGVLDLPGALARFRRAYPEVALSLRAGLVGELCAALDAGRLDVVIGPLDDTQRSGRRTRRLASDTIVLITEVGRPALALRDVRNEPFVCLPPDSGLRRILDSASGRAGFEPRVEFETRTAADVRQFVSAGLGVALLAASAARSPGAPVTVHDLRPAPSHPPISLAAARGRPLSPAARRLRDLLVDSA